MKKLTKFLFGRMTIVALLIALQLLIGIFVLTVFNQYSVPLQIFTLAIVLATLIDIINRDFIPDAKLPWVVTVLLMPIGGVLIYAMMSRNRIAKKDIKFLTALSNQTRSLLTDHKAKSQDYQQHLLGHYNQSQYLLNTSGAMICGNTDTQYFADGQHFYKDLLGELVKAQKYIFLEYFIIEQGVMWDGILDILREKVSQGVVVKVMYDDMGCVNKLPSNYHKILRALGIECVVFNKLTPIATVLHNNRDHRKITVIDGTIGYVGGINLADEYINHIHPYGYWKDTAVKLVGEGVKNLTVMFLQLFSIVTKQLEDFDKYNPSEYPTTADAGYVVPFGDGPNPFYKELIAQQTYINIINQATDYVYITTPYLIPDNALKSSLRSASQRGVDVRIYTPGIPDKKIVFWLTQYNYATLLDAGVKIYQLDAGFLHAKSIVADGCVAIVGTINLDYRSLLHHYECGVWMYKTRAITQLTLDLATMQEQCTEITKSPLNNLQRFVCRILYLYAALL